MDAGEQEGMQLISSQVAAGALAVVCVLPALTSCRSDETERALPPPVASPSLEGAPAPSPWSVDIAQQRAERALVPEAALQPLSMTMIDDFTGSAPLSPCRLVAAERQWVALGHGRKWVARKGTEDEALVEQYVRPFTERRLVASAAEVIDQIRAVNTCKTYNSREGEPKVGTELKLPILPGVEAQYAFCEQIVRPAAEPYGACSVFLARAEIVSKVRVRTASEARAKELIPTLAVAAAKALTAVK
jgi:hypothetical protein